MIQVKPKPKYVGAVLQKRIDYVNPVTDEGLIGTIIESDFALRGNYNEFLALNEEAKEAHAAFMAAVEKMQNMKVWLSSSHIYDPLTKTWSLATKSGDTP